MSKSISNELTRRHVSNTHPEPGQFLGLATCILMAFALVGGFGLVLAFAGIICWIFYWVKIAEYSRFFDAFIRTP